MLKASIFYWRRDHIREIFRLHERLLHGARCNTANNERVVHTNFYMHVFLTSLYFSSWCAILVQVNFAPPDEGIWPSTAHLPYNFANDRNVYLGVLVYQALGNVGNVIWAGIADSFYIALIGIVCGHVTQLKQRLEQLGTEFDDDSLFYSDLIKYCVMYEDCLR